MTDPMTPTRDSGRNEAAEKLWDESFLFRLGYEYGADPKSHEHFDGCGHAGEGVEVEFLRGWRESRALATPSTAETER